MENKIDHNKNILDVCCGSRMFYYDRKNENVLFCDNRILDTILCDGRELHVSPDQIEDFRNLSFPDNHFDAVIYDPPHLKQCGTKSWLALKYGKLPKEGYREYVTKGFCECFRVLKPGHLLIFKWNEEQIPFKEITKNFPLEPLMGDRRGKTRWVTYFKPRQ